jgi:DNA adenine methylase
MTEPFLKWAGGKRWLANSQQLPLPPAYNRYIEPFLGGAAIFFHLRPAKALLSDVNPELIELYEVIRDDPEALMAVMELHHARHGYEYYYKMRASVPSDRVSRAARTMYLNRTCWNGLYRVNLRGAFNVPIGTKTSVVFQHDDFGAISELLKSANIRCSDFEPVVAEASEGDFVFIDPPYTVRHNLNGFNKYNENLFGWSDQIRLRDAVAFAIDRGASVVVTNADHHSIRELYSGLCSYRSVARSSVLAGETAKRGQTTEALFFANL